MILQQFFEALGLIKPSTETGANRRLRTSPPGTRKYRAKRNKARRVTRASRRANRRH